MLLAGEMLIVPIVVNPVRHFPKSHQYDFKLLAFPLPEGFCHSQDLTLLTLLTFPCEKQKMLLVGKMLLMYQNVKSKKNFTKSPKHDLTVLTFPLLEAFFPQRGFNTTLFISRCSLFRGVDRRTTLYKLGFGGCFT